MDIGGCVNRFHRHSYMDFLQQSQQGELELMVDGSLGRDGSVRLMYVQQIRHRL